MEPLPQPIGLGLASILPDDNELQEAKHILACWSNDRLRIQLALLEQFLKTDWVATPGDEADTPTQQQLELFIVHQVRCNSDALTTQFILDNVSYYTFMRRKEKIIHSMIHGPTRQTMQQTLTLPAGKVGASDRFARLPLRPGMYLKGVHYEPHEPPKSGNISTGAAASSSDSNNIQTVSINTGPASSSNSSAAPASISTPPAGNEELIEAENEAIERIRLDRQMMKYRIQQEAPPQLRSEMNTTRSPSPITPSTPPITPSTPPSKRAKTRAQ